VSSAVSFVLYPAQISKNEVSPKQILNKSGFAAAQNASRFQSATKQITSGPAIPANHIAPFHFHPIAKSLTIQPNNQLFPFVRSPIQRERHFQYSALVTATTDRQIEVQHHIQFIILNIDWGLSRWRNLLIQKKIWSSILLMGFYVALVEQSWRGLMAFRA
jgi:hypothetical protein